MPRKPVEAKIAEIPPYALPPAGPCHATALRKAMRRVSLLYDAALAPSGLRATQRSILVHIARLGRPTMSELAAALVLDRSALAHNLKPLERDGLLRSLVDEDDRRARYAVLTEAGRAKLGETAPLWEKAQSRFEAALGDDAARDLRQALERVASTAFVDAELPAARQPEPVSRAGPDDRAPSRARGPAPSRRR